MNQTAHPSADSVSGAPRANRLAGSASPYLLQHAYNPVDWYPWGEEAIAKARTEDKPIFLSIGYAACHWCHVMERESFENPEIAAYLNRHFVSIKVDREERPDLDEIYMSAVQAMTGQGGWPMSMFLTPDLKPFYGGTYFPPRDKYGRQGFPSVLSGIVAVWKNRREEVLKSANGLTDHLQTLLGRQHGERGMLSEALISGALTALRSTFDREHGGWGGAPKFPSSTSISLLLRAWRCSGDQDLMDMTALTLDRMALGGLYDQLGGGYHRYSTDAHWLTPHFEKMLYDNAQLVRAYLEAYQATGKALYRRVARETLEYLLRDMRDEDGGFHSSEDADSEGEEGRFYLWTQAEIFEVLGQTAGAAFCDFYQVNPDGNFLSHEPYHDAQNILHSYAPPEDQGEEWAENMARMRVKLLERRALRTRPGRDDKVLTVWNAMTISALARGAQVLDEPRYLRAAEEAGAFLLEEMLCNGVLMRVYRAGECHQPAFLDDYAATINAFIDLYESALDINWLIAAKELAQNMIDRFWDEEQGVFCYTEADRSDVLVRARSAYDGAEPSGNSTAAMALLRLARLTGDTSYEDRARRILEANAASMTRAPQAFLAMLGAVGFLLDPPMEIVIAGTRGSAEVNALMKTIHARFLPNKTIACIGPDDDADAISLEHIPLLQGKTHMDNTATAYVCRNNTCSPPVADPEELAQLLDQLSLASEPGFGKDR